MRTAFYSLMISLVCLTGVSRFSFIQAQDIDHPQTALVQLRAQYTRAAAQEDYCRMLQLMDSIMLMERSIDHRATNTVRTEFEGYAPQFSHKAEGRVLYRLYMQHLGSAAYRNNVVAALQKDKDSLLLLSDPWYEQHLIHGSKSSYPCANLYEVALFAQIGEYTNSALFDAFTQLYDSRKGNYPANYIYIELYKMRYDRGYTQTARLQRIDSLITVFANTEPITQALVEKAQILLSQGRSEDDPKKAEAFFTRVRILCRKAMRDFPLSALKKQFKSIVRMLNEPAFEVSMKEQTHPQSPLKVTVSHTNVNSLTLTLTDKNGKKVSRHKFSRLKEPLYISVKDTFILETPPEGSYKLTVKHKKQIQRTSFYVGKVAGMFRGNRARGYVYAVDLLSGKPFPKVDMAFLPERDYANKPKAQLPTIALKMDGFTLVPFAAAHNEVLQNRQLSFRLVLPPQEGSVCDSFSTPLRISRWNLGQESKGQQESTSTSLFTDRKLYKPADSIYFKGIVTRYSNGKVQTVAGRPMTVYLSSATNWRDTIARAECVTNDYGSFSGAFATNSRFMNGMYNIYTEGDAVTVRLEQYSRPTFTVEMMESDTVVSFGESYIQKGHVQNNAGFAVADATVAYTVTRRPLSRSYLWRYSPYFYEETTLAQGSVQTDAQGNFEIPYTALRPVTDALALCAFQVKVDVSDALGETHPAMATLCVGDQPIVYQASMPSVVIKETAPVINVKALNLNGKEQMIDVMFSLKVNGQKVYEALTHNGNTPQPQWDQLPSGEYTLYYGIKDSLNFVMLGLQDTQSPTSQPLFFYALDGKTPAILLGTREPRVYVLAEFFDGDSLCHKQIIEHEMGLKAYSFPTLKDYPQSLTLKALTVVRGECITREHLFSTPTEKPLEMKLHSFRNNAQPNTKTEFSIEVNPKANAELLVSIYNASTDRLGANSFAWSPANISKPYVRSIQKEFDAVTRGQSIERVLFDMGEEVIMEEAVMNTPRYQVMGRSTSVQSAAVLSTTAKNAASAEESDTDAAAETTATGDVSTDATDASANIRTDFAETLVFLPHLLASGEEGLYPVQFRTNGLLSTFRVLAMAHTPQGRIAQFEDRLTVNKEVMVMPSYPAFLRMGDSIDLGVKAVNLTTATISATEKVQINDEVIGERTVSLAPQGQLNLRWPYRTLAATQNDEPQLLTLLTQLQSDLHSDAQQDVIPVLSRQEQVVRAQTAGLKGLGTITIHPQQAHSILQYEVTTPVVAAMSSLPALTEPKGENLISWIGAYYVNTVGAALLKQNPQLEQWIKDLPQGQSTQLQGKENLTQIYLEETPWAAYRYKEEDRMRELLQLTDKEYVTQIQQQAWSKFAALQQSNGGLSWFPGMDASYMLTLYFLEQMAALEPYNVSQRQAAVIENALHYLDHTFATMYTKKVRDKMKKDYIPYDATLFFYVRTAWSSIPYREDVLDAVNYFLPLMDKAWEGKSIMEKAYWALIYRTVGKTAPLVAVTSSLREFVVKNKDMGCYFPNAVGQPGLMSSQLRSHAMLLQVFKDDTSISSGLQQWLLLQKKNHIWENETNTTKVVAALLETGALDIPNYEIIPVGRSSIIKNRSRTPLFASLYEQTVEDIRDVEAFSNGLEVSREFTRDGKPLLDGDVLHLGDKITVRFHLDNTESRSFVHLQSLRAACLTPVVESSLYQWGGSCGYYREVKDSATNYFFQELTEGEHAIEESFYVTQSGVFNSGWAKIQSLYAPEYRGHSTSGTLRSQQD